MAQCGTSSKRRYASSSFSVAFWFSASFFLVLLRAGTVDATRIAFHPSDGWQDLIGDEVTRDRSFTVPAICKDTEVFKVKVPYEIDIYGTETKVDRIVRVDGVPFPLIDGKHVILDVDHNNASIAELCMAHDRTMRDVSKGANTFGVLTQAEMQPQKPKRVTYMVLYNEVMGAKAPAGSMLDAEGLPAVRTYVSKSMYPTFMKINAFQYITDILLDDDELYVFIRRHFLFPGLYLLFASRTNVHTSANVLGLVMFFCLIFFFEMQANFGYIMLKFIISMSTSLAGGREGQQRGTLFSVGMMASGVLAAMCRRAAANPAGAFFGTMVSMLIPVVTIILPTRIDMAGVVRFDHSLVYVRWLPLFLSIIDGVSLTTIVSLGIMFAIDPRLYKPASLYMLAYIAHFGGRLVGASQVAYYEQTAMYFYATKRYCRTHICGGTVPGITSPDIVKIMQSMELKFAFTDAALAVLLLIILGLATVKFVTVQGGKKVDRPDFFHYGFLGSVFFIQAFNPFAEFSSTAVTLLNAIIAGIKWALIFNAPVEALCLHVLALLLGVVCFFGVSQDLESSTLREAAVTRFTDAIDVAKLRVLSDHVIDLEFQFADSSVHGKGLAIGRNYFMTVRHVADPHLNKQQPLSVTISRSGRNAKNYKVLNIMYFPRNPGSDGICIVVLDNDLDFYDTKGVVTLSSESSAATAYYLRSDGTLSPVIRMGKSMECGYMKVMLNTEAGDSGTPVLDGHGNIIGVHMGHINGKWNAFIPVSDELERLVSSNRFTAGGESGSLVSRYATLPESDQFIARIESHISEHTKMIELPQNVANFDTNFGNTIMTLADKLSTLTGQVASLATLSEKRKTDGPNAQRAQQGPQQGGKHAGGSSRQHWRSDNLATHIEGTTTSAPTFVSYGFHAVPPPPPPVQPSSTAGLGFSEQQQVAPSAVNTTSTRPVAETKATFEQTSASVAGPSSASGAKSYSEATKGGSSKDAK